MNLRPHRWEDRLITELRDASQKPFDPKRWNCATFAHRCATAVTGRKIVYSWKGSLEASADALFSRVDTTLAQRGDVVLADVPQPSLGVCVGRDAAFVTASGLMTRPMSAVRLAWSV